MPNRVYLDHAATSPIYAEVIEAMAKQMAVVGNASSLHTSGRNARSVVEESRERIAAALGARPSEVIFTSGGTEGDNLAIKGTYRATRRIDAARDRLIVSGIEHHAVLDAVEALVATEDARVTWVEPDADGVVTAHAVRTALEADGGAGTVALVSVMWANNEVGTVQPIAEIGAVCAKFGIPFHTDAVQAVGHLGVDFGASGATMLALSGHKVGGPQGVGALLLARDARLDPLTHGGGQERQVRSGTLDVAGILGLAEAVEKSCATREGEAARLAKLRDRLVEGALALDLGVSVSGFYEAGDVERRLPGNAHLRVPGCDGDSMLYLLDAAGVECSTGSACQAGVPRPSHVLLAMGIPEEQARGALRLTLGHTSTDDDVDAFLRELPAVAERARRAQEATRKVS
ncbi:cysteine desulfurase [Dermacoccus sp. PAMC28757]|nr:MULTISPECIES: cysteine desulfurase family protein [Dermacoccus]QNK52526.1 cysteine desulfurase [Dermacoccus sp. PAMC28757]